jgi:hypothetical protein
LVFLGLTISLSGLATGDEIPDASSGALEVPAGQEEASPVPSAGEEDGFAYTNYDKWKSKDINGAVSLERDMFGGIVRPLVGFRLNYIDVDDYTGEQVTMELGHPF